MSFLNYLNPYSYFTTTTPPEERARKREFEAMQREEKESEDMRVVAAREAAERYLEAQVAARREEEDMLRREQKKGSEDTVATEAKAGIPRRLDSSRFAFLTSPGGGISGGAGAASSPSVQQRAHEYEKLREREPVVEDTVARREAQAIANSGTVSTLPFRSGARRVGSQVQQFNALEHLNSELQHLLVELKVLSAYEEMCTWVIPEENMDTYIRGVTAVLPRPCKIRVRACVTEHDNPQEERVVMIKRWAKYGEKELIREIGTALGVDDDTDLAVRKMTAASKLASIVFPVVLNQEGDVEGTFFIYRPSFVKALCQPVDDDGTDVIAKKARLEVKIRSVQRKIAEEKRKITSDGGRRRRAQARAQAFLHAVGAGGRFRAYS